MIIFVRITANTMRRFPIALTFLVLALISCSRYETAKNDPMNARVYTLGNGMKVYMSVSKDEPRIQANIAVRVGGKDDPADNTGLSHYLERNYSGAPDLTINLGWREAFAARL